MNTFAFSDNQKLAYDATNGIAREGYTKEQMNDAVRNVIKEACGGEWNYYNFMKNRYDVFAIMAEIMPVAMNASLAGKFDGFADFADTALGDKPYFWVEDNQVYPVYTAARGNGDTDRQKIVDRNFTVATTVKSIKFYEELDALLSGKMDMARLSEKASGAMAAYAGQLISDTIYGSYASVDTEYKATGTFSADTLAGIIEHVKAANGVDGVQIFGTTTALGNITDGAGYSDRAKDVFNGLGYYDTFRGSDLIALPQAYKAQSQTLAVDTAHVIVVPVSDEKIVKVLFEGTPYIDLKDGSSRNDLQPEVIFQRRIGAAALTVPEGKFGFYKFS